MITDPVKSLARTKAAIEAYDALDEEWRQIDETDTLSGPEILVWLDRLEEAGKAVAVAFSQDTADRNSPEHCAHLRPGPKVPGPGFELSFLRKAVKRWEERQNTL